MPPLLEGYVEVDLRGIVGVERVTVRAPDDTTAKEMARRLRAMLNV